MRMLSAKNGWILGVLMISVLMSLALRKPRGETEKAFTLSFSQDAPIQSEASSVSLDLSSDQPNNGRRELFSMLSGLQYDYYHNTCPEAENIVRSTMAQIYSQHKGVSPALLRLFFHDCFIHGCDASLLLDQSDGEEHSTEKKAVPNTTLKGFNWIDMIKEELERVCPEVVSCADIISLATRDGVVLAGGPFYPVFTGRKDSSQSFYEEAMAQIPKPDDNINQTLHLFSLRGFDERETVSLLGGHNIGRIGCQFIEQRLYNFSGTGKPDPTISPDFLIEMRIKCGGNNSSRVGSFTQSNEASEAMAMNTGGYSSGLSYFQELTSSIQSGAGFGTHYYQQLLRGRGLLFADQQLMAEDKTSRLVRAYASDDGSTFRMDFARAMLKMSGLDVLIGSQGQVRLRCSLPLPSFS